jgi:hypothetical protein
MQMSTEGAGALRPETSRESQIAAIEVARIPCGQVDLVLAGRYLIKVALKIKVAIGAATQLLNGRPPKSGQASG